MIVFSSPVHLTKHTQKHARTFVWLKRNVEMSNIWVVCWHGWSRGFLHYIYGGHIFTRILQVLLQMYKQPCNKVEVWRSRSCWFRAARASYFEKFKTRALVVWLILVCQYLTFAVDSGSRLKLKIELKLNVHVGRMKQTISHCVIFGFKSSTFRSFSIFQIKPHRKCWQFVSQDWPTRQA